MRLCYSGSSTHRLVRHVLQGGRQQQRVDGHLLPADVLRHPGEAFGLGERRAGGKNVGDEGGDARDKHAAWEKQKGDDFEGGVGGGEGEGEES